MYFLVKDARLFLSYLVLSCGMIVVSPCFRRLFGWLLSKKVARVPVNISLSFLHWVWIRDAPIRHWLIIGRPIISA